MEPRAIDTYGAPYEDEAPVENPKTQMSSGYGNRLCEDTAQLTRTAFHAIVQFETVTTASVPYIYSANDVSIRTMWGDGASYKPTVTKTADPGRYTIEFSASYSDGLSVSENVDFFDGYVFARSTDPTDEPLARILTLASATVTIATYDAPAWPPTLADDCASTNLMTVSLFLV